MARTPRIGTGKRRLARDIGACEAGRFYRTSVARLLRRLSPDPRWDLWLAITPEHEVRAKGLWPFNGFVISQGRGDLGQRMGRLFQILPPGPVAIIGSDIPDVSPHHAAEAFRALGENDWVLGPGTDGGYWLIGARRRPRVSYPFAGVRWSSPHALEDTEANLEGQRVALLQVLEDVDDGEDYSRWRKKRSRGVPSSAA